ncbi:uncharacterized protein LOC107039168 [Diachasma alloeum]|uniref:uncharacterized protein LOC107039168 n=1 Tax=Diachasma alloeum TaxID=454923 RepID=UPI000738276D|nr:uncharacterized protein LOC107039168 [Diachasma alloeum]
MAKFVHFVILGLLTIIHVANCDNNREYLFRKYVNICRKKISQKSTTAVEECILETAKIFDGAQGRVNVKLFRDILEKIMDPSVRDQNPPVVAKFKKCVKGKNFSSAKDLVQALQMCNFNTAVLYNF